MDWKQLLAYITGSVDEELLLRNAYLAAENRILRNQITGRVHLMDAERKTLADMGKKLAKQALAEVAHIVTPDTILSWHRKLVAGGVLIQLTSCYHMSTNTMAYSWRRTMAFVPVQCPECLSTDVVQYGKQANGTQRYRCGNRDCPRTIFLLQYHDTGRLPAVKQQIVDMTLNGSGVRDIVRVLGVSSATVIDVLKKN